MAAIHTFLVVSIAAATLTHGSRVKHYAAVHDQQSSVRAEGDKSFLLQLIQSVHDQQSSMRAEGNQSILLQLTQSASVASESNTTVGTGGWIRNLAFSCALALALLNPSVEGANIMHNPMAAGAWHVDGMAPMRAGDFAPPRDLFAMPRVQELDVSFDGTSIEKAAQSDLDALEHGILPVLDLKDEGQKIAEMLEDNDVTGAMTRAAAIVAVEHGGAPVEALIKAGATIHPEATMEENAKQFNNIVADYEARILKNEVITDLHVPMTGLAQNVAFPLYRILRRGVTNEAYREYFRKDMVRGGRDAGRAIGGVLRAARTQHVRQLQNFKPGELDSLQHVWLVD